METVEREENNTEKTAAVIRYLSLEEFAKAENISDADLEWVRPAAGFGMRTIMQAAKQNTDIKNANISLLGRRA